MIDTDVLVVGAGPTGLALATRLRRAGHRPFVVERLAEGQNTSRAAVVHAHTLEALAEIGIAERMMAEGMPIANFCIRDGDRLLARMSFDQLPSRYACLLMIPQDTTEAILRDAHAAAGGEVHWGHTVTALRDVAGGVQATLDTPEGPKVVRARYAVGADGMHSIVRNAVGVEFEGSSYEESFVLADVEMRWPLRADEVALYFSPKGVLVVAPLPRGRFRIVATCEEAPPRPGVDTIQAILDERGPAGAHVETVFWSSRFRLHHRLAKRYRAGRMLLMGDAAHVHSPAGGQGMNTGLVDACVLGRMLDEVLSGRRPDAFLDHYERLRRPAAKKVLSLAGRLTSAAMLRNPVKRALRNLVFRLVGSLPFSRRRVEMNLSGLSRRGHARVPGLDDGRLQDARALAVAAKAG